MTRILPDRLYVSYMHHPWSPQRREASKPFTGAELIASTADGADFSLENAVRWINANNPRSGLRDREVYEIELLIPEPVVHDLDPVMGQYDESCEDGRMLFERHIWLVDRWVRQWRSCPLELYVFLLNTTPDVTGLRLKMAVEEELSFLYPWINLV